MMAVWAVGLFVAVIGYPVLHEWGHVVAAVLVGAEVEAVTLWPLPTVLCNVTGIAPAGMVWIGCGGTALPLLVSLAIPRRWFVTWYGRALLQGESVLALLISAVSVLFSVNPRDDMVRILPYVAGGKAVLVSVPVSVAAGVAVGLWAERPLTRIGNFFHL